MSESVATPGRADCNRAGATAYTDYGPRRAPVVVLIHGVGMNQAVWDAQLQDLAVDHRVLTYDLLGHGQSALPPEPTLLADLANQLAMLLDTLGLDRVTLIGHSMGALVALEFALSFPERVSALVALNAVFQRTAQQRGAVIDRAEQIARDQTLTGNQETVARWFTEKERAASPDAIERIRGWLDAVDIQGYARIYKAFAAGDDAFDGRLDMLGAPALFMTGEDDPNSTPEMSRQLAKHAPRGRFEVLADQRHMMAYIAPRLVNRHIRAFIEEQQRGGSQGAKPAERAADDSRRGEPHDDTSD